MLIGGLLFDKIIGTAVLKILLRCKEVVLEIRLVQRMEWDPSMFD